MIWTSVHDFWHLGGQGGYVWGSVGVVAAFLVIEGLALRLRRRAALAAARHTR